MDAMQEEKEVSDKELTISRILEKRNRNDADPHFKFRKNVEKIENAMSRGNFKTFLTHFHALLHNLAVVTEDKKWKQTVQNAYRKMEGFVSYFREKSDSSEILSVLETIGDIHLKFENIELTYVYWKELLDRRMIEKSEKATSAFEDLATVAYFLRPHFMKDCFDLAQKVKKYIEEESLIEKDPHAYNVTNRFMLYYLNTERRFEDGLKTCYNALKFKGLDDTEKCLVYKFMSHFYSLTAKHDMAEKVIRTKLMPITEKWKNSEDLNYFDLYISSLSTLTGYFFMAGKYQEGIEIGFNALETIQSNPDYSNKKYEDEIKRWIGAPANFKNMRRMNNCWYVLAYILFHEKKFKSALYFVGKALGEDESLELDSDFRSLRGRIYAQSEMYEEAIKDLQFAKANFKMTENTQNYDLIRDPLIPCLLELINCYSKIGYGEECLEVCDFMNTLPDYVFRVVIESYVKFKKFDSFFSMYKKIKKESDRQKFDLFTFQGQALFELEDYQEAKQSFLFALEKLVNEKSQMRFITLLYYGNCLRKLEENPDTVLKVFDDALKLFGSLDNKDNLRPLRSALLLNKCIVFMECNKKNDPNKILNLLNRKIITTGIFHSIIKSDAPKILKLMRKQYEMKELRSFQPEIESYANSIAIAQHFEKI